MSAAFGVAVKEAVVTRVLANSWLPINWPFLVNEPHAGCSRVAVGTGGRVGKGRGEGKDEGWGEREGEGWGQREGEEWSEGGGVE